MIAQWKRPPVLIVGGILLLLVLGVVFGAGLRFYSAYMTQTGLVSDDRPVEIAVAAETLIVPANMLRSGKLRRGGAAERADLALHWPDLNGYTDETADDFRDGSPKAPVIYATVAARDAPVDSTGRLDSVYARFFTGKPFPGPAGLVGRRLSPESGYAGEVVFFVPSEPRPFVARCTEASSDEIPATCIRDINFGRSLSLFYRFDRDLLADWRALDAGMRERATGFLRD